MNINDAGSYISKNAPRLRFWFLTVPTLILLLLYFFWHPYSCHDPATEFKKSFAADKTKDSVVTHGIDSIQVNVRLPLALEDHRQDSIVTALKPRSTAATGTIRRIAEDNLAPLQVDTIRAALAVKDSLIAALDTEITILRLDSAAQAEQLRRSEAGRAANLAADSITGVKAIVEINAANAKAKGAFKHGVMLGAAGAALAIISIVWLTH